MNKKVTVFTYVVSIIVCIIGAVALTVLYCDNKLEDTTTEMQGKIDKEMLIRAQVERRSDELEEEKVELQKRYEQLDKEILRVREDNEILNDVIVRMRIAPKADKLLKERLPYGMTNTLRFMNYRKITDKNSIQYKLQEDCDTDVDSGIRVFYANGTDYYCVALGSAYGRDIGDTWHVTLACGTEFDIILADFKDDGATDYFGQPDKNYDGDPCTSVIEFVTDEDYMPSSVLSAGTYTVFGSLGGLHGKGGNIIEMKYLGRVWE